MRRKIDVTPGEMLELRERGYSNHDIAKSLDVSEQTVRRYIGKQNGRMEGLAAFKDDKPIEKKETELVLPKYDPKPLVETFKVSRCRIMLDHENRCVLIDDDIMLPYDKIPDIVQFLA